MTIERLVELLVAAIAGGLILQIATALKYRHDAQREDSQAKRDGEQHATDSLVTGTKTLVDATDTVVRLQDSQIDDLKQIIETQRIQTQKRFDAQAATIAAYETRLDREMQRRYESEATVRVLNGEINDLRDQLADLRSSLKASEEDRKNASEENAGLRNALFNVALGVNALSRQLHEAGLNPVYVLDVPVLGLKPDEETR